MTGLFNQALSGCSSCFSMLKLFVQVPFRFHSSKKIFGIVYKWRPSITEGVLRARLASVTRTKIHHREKRGENKAMWKFECRRNC